MALSYIFGGIVVWTVVSTAVQFYQMFYAPPCPEGAAANKCSRPLFAKDEAVDVYVYLTTNPGLQWWTAEGLEELSGALLWNATGVSYGESVEPAKVPVPLSLPILAAVRANESALTAHVFLARAGRSLKEEVLALPGSDEPPFPGAVVMNMDVLHASAEVTQLKPETAKKRRNLLGNASDDGEDDAASGAVDAVLPLVGLAVKIFPGDALMWAGSVFVLAAFFPPWMPSAITRHVLAVAVVPWLVHLRGVAKEKAREKRQEVEERSLWQWDEPGRIVPHLVGTVRIALSADFGAYDARAPPPLLYKEMIFKDGHGPLPVAERDVRYTVLTHESGLSYAPPLAIDTYGMQQRSWRALDGNASKDDPEIPVELEVTRVVKYSIVETIKQNMQTYTRMGFTDRDFDDVKDFMFRYPLHIMALMQLIGFAQMTLTTLAFKNDISFFKGRTSYAGLSSRSLATDTLQEIVIFLYLYDFEDISRLVLFQVGTSSVISAWKYVNVARLGIFWAFLLPWISFNRGKNANSDEENTEEIDAKGMMYLKFVMYPLSAAWGLYNLYHYSYKSWWSWLVSSLADFAYTFGFINMLPQIFINYKLKSVAHMPWRVLMYKFFNTFIDDVFAFFIMSDYMTKKHRFMTLRDDVVFFVFLYQRHIYKIDPTRPDEFGYVYNEEASGAAEQTLEDEGKPLDLVLTEGPSGFERRGGAPERIHVDKVLDDSWASSSGLEVDDEIISVNNVAVTEHSNESLDSAILARPLRLSVRRASKKEK